MLFRSQPIATRGKKARGTLLVDSGSSIKRAPLSVSYYNEISAAIYGGALYGGGALPAQYCPCGAVGTVHHSMTSFHDGSSAYRHLANK